MYSACALCNYLVLFLCGGVLANHGPVDFTFTKFHAVANPAFYRSACYSSGAQAFTPNLTIVDPQHTVSTSNGQLTAAFCSTLNVTAPQTQTLGSSSCSVSGNQVSLSIVTDLSNGTAYSLSCTFNVFVQSFCNNGQGNGHGNGNGNGGWGNGGWGNGNGYKRSVSKRQQTFGGGHPNCASLTTFDTCMAGCVQPPTSSSPLSNCPCIWDPRMPNGSFFPIVGGTESVAAIFSSCSPGQICCFNQPCSAYGDPQTCLLGGGALVDNMGNPIAGTGNCAFSGGQCSCASPLTNSPDESSFPSSINLGTITAPFDCTCAGTGYDGANFSTCVVSQPAPPLVNFEYGLRVAIALDVLTRQLFVAGCNPCRVSVGGDPGRARGACDTFAGQLSQKQLPFFNQAHQVGCSVYLQADHCSVGWGAANQIASTDNLVTIELYNASPASKTLLAFGAFVVALVAALL